MMKFADNNNVSSLINMISFYFNKGFHFKMFFDSDCTSYHSTQECLLIMSAEDIARKMKKLLHYKQTRLIEIQQKIKDQTDKHYTEVEFCVS